MIPALYQNTAGQLAIICPDQEDFLGVPQALLFEVERWMAVASILGEARQDYGGGYMRRSSGAPWHGARFITWPAPQWELVQEQEHEEEGELYCDGSSGGGLGASH